MDPWWYLPVREQIKFLLVNSVELQTLFSRDKVASIPRTCLCNNGHQQKIMSSPLDGEMIQSHISKYTSDLLVPISGKAKLIQMFHHL